MTAGDFEKPTNPSEPQNLSEHAPITDEELYQTLDSKLNSWDFKQHTETENVAFAYSVTSLVSDNFHYLNYAGSGEFSAEELPGTLHPVYSDIWSPDGKSEVFYTPDMKVWRVTRREEHTEIAMHLPGFEEMSEGKTFNQILEALESDPSLLEKIIPGETIVDEAIIIVLAKGYSGSGLELIVEPGHISLAIYGDLGKTRNLSGFLARYHNNPSELARISASLAVLGAKYCRRPDHYQASGARLTELDKKFLSGL
jgi:hypothetical protein